MAIGKSTKMRRVKVKKDYSSKNLANPFFRHRRKGKSSAPEKMRRAQTKGGRRGRIWLRFILTLIPMIALAWVAFYSPLFRVDSIEVKGLERISQDAVAKETRQYVQEHQNLLWLDIDELASKVNENFNFESIMISKRLPGTLTLQVNERRVAFIWIEADGQQYLADSQAKVISGYSLSDEEKPSYLAVVNRSSESLAAEGQIKIGEKSLSFILALYGIIKDSYSLESAWIDDEANKVIFKFKDFPEAYFNVNLDPQSQLDNLMLVKQETEAKEAGSFGKLQYVDLRYGNLVYYK